MARERMVTRTVMVTEVEVMTLNITTAEVQILTYEMSGLYTEQNALLKALKKQYETDEVKCVAIQSINEKELLYGMKEIDFIRQATILPPRTKADEQ